MSKTTQVATKPSLKKRAPAAVGTMARPHGFAGASMRLANREDKHERQAEEAAARIVRGEKGVGKRLSPAPAASLRLRASRGEPLLTPLRLELEEVFGADLTAVRIHRDRPANAASEMQSAQAFTAGADVYFAPGRFDARSEAGQRLLLHEIAHVLQQTGRTTGDGRLRATDIASSGVPQYKPMEELFQDNKFFDTVPTLSDVAALYRAAYKDDKALQDKVTHVVQLLGDFQDDHPQAQTLIQETNDPAFANVSDPIRAFYVDCLKGIKKFDAAKALLEKHETLKTAFGVSGFYSGFFSADLTWLDAEMGVKSLRPYWPDRYVNTFRIFWLAPARPIQNLSNDKPRFEQFVEEELDKARSGKTLIENERYYAALLALQEVDDQRLVILKYFLAHPGEGLTMAEDRRSSAQRFVENFETYKNNARPHHSAEGGALLTAITPKLIKAAKQVADFWDQVENLETARGMGTDFATFGPADEFIKAIKTNPRLKGLESYLLMFGSQVFKLMPGGKIPDAAYYEAVVNNLKASVREQMVQYGILLSAIFGRLPVDKAPEESDLRPALQYGWVIWHLSKLLALLDGYSKTEDLEFQKKLNALSPNAPPQKHDDIRIAHRLRLTVFLYSLGNMLGYKALVDLTLQVGFARQPGQKNSLLALLGEWEPQKDVELAALTRDFNASLPIRGLEAITWGDLQLFLYIGYFDELATQLRGLLKEQEKDFSGDKGSILNQAADKMKSVPQPQRLIMTNVAKAVREEDRLNFGKVVESHPKYKAFLDSLGPNEVVAIPDAYSVHNEGVVLWRIPALDQFVMLLQNVPDLDDLVQKQIEADSKEEEAQRKKAARAGKKQAPAAAAANWWLWLKALAKVLKQDPSYRQKITDELKSDYDAARQDFTGLARRASTHLRRVVRETLIEPAWKRYDVADIRTFTEPLKAIRATTSFGVSVVPPEERFLQLTALMLELAPILNDKLGVSETVLGISLPGTGRLDIIINLLPTIQGALLILDDPKQQKPLKAILYPDVIDDKKLKTNRDLLETLKTQMESTHLEAQTERGLAASKDSQSLHGVGYGFTLKAGEKIPNTDDKIVKVSETFTYHPALGKPTGGIQFPKGEFGGGLLLDGAGKKLQPTGRLLLTIQRKERTIEITDQDDDLLSEVTYAVAMAAINKQMEDLADALDTFGEVLLTGIELIPGIGQEVMVARLVASVLTFVTSPEFEQIKLLLSQDGSQLIQKGLDAIKSWVTPDLLWQWLLFGRKLFPTLPEITAPGRQDAIQKKMTSDAPKGRLKRIIDRLVKLAKKIGHSIHRLHDFIQFPVRRLQLWVLGHPIVDLALHFIYTNIERLYALEFKDLELGVETAYKTGADVQGAMNEISGQVAAIFDAIRALELPEEIVSLEDIVSLVLDLVTDHLGGKYKVGIKVIKAGLKLIGAWDKITGAIANELRSQDLDPNIIWRSEVKARLQPPLHDICSDFADTMVGAIAQVPFLKGFLKPPVPTIELEPFGADFPEERSDVSAPEAQPFALPGRLRQWPGAPLPSPGRGEPLPAPLAADAAMRFGHDFSHVRLHTGAEGGRVTEAFGAEGVTTGSHVHLRPGLAPDSRDGRHVLNHELTHVLQQTGPRPLGGAYSPQPVAGEPGKGLHIHPGQEAAAERVAGQVEAHPASRPVDIGAGGAAGAQPAFTLKFMYEFLGKVVSDEQFQKRVGEVEAVKPEAALGYLEEEDKEFAKSFPAKLTDAIGKLKGDAKNFRPPFNKVPDKIIDYVIKNHGDTIRNAIPQLVVASRNEVQIKGEEDAEGKATTKIAQRLDPDRFELELQEFLFGVTGVYFNMGLKTKKIQPENEKKARKTVDMDAPFDKLAVSYVHIAYIGGGATLWDLVMTNSFETKHGKALTKGKYTPQDRSKYQAKARLLLRTLGPDPTVWARNEFRFADTTVERIESLVHPPDALPPTVLPPAVDYVKDEQTATNYGATYGNIALRFGTYKQRVNGIQFGFERDAHHMTQYLLLEYFRNSKGAYQPFPRSLSLYPGVHGSGRLVDTIERTDGAKIDIANYERGRGEEMPTILLSRFAHVYGNVHIEGVADDTKDNRRSPGNAVHRQYKEALGLDYTEIVFSPIGAKDKLTQAHKQGPAYAALPGVVPGGGGPDQVQIGGKLVTPSMLQEQIFNAACKTYTWMRDDMMERLESGLLSQEKQYYAGIAEVAPAAKGSDNKIKPEFTVTDPQLKKVHETAKKKNKEIMEDSTKAGFREMK